MFCWLIFFINVEIAVVSYEPEDQIKEKKLITLNQEVIPFYLEKLEQTVKDNDGKFALKRVRFIFFIKVHPIDNPYFNFS